mmetsp:Transcript_5992/g.12002  ORF Transcript_5992/g.12002 Transcript_5992/m.12002 type:complete len:127 (-) Transcript_5992:134-514(-)|eukprot:CAMPEP_0113825166 /NCGR_PEP_ID=MMETSP0328-20130328/3612_1 /TAXON_ID=39455 /ORGANISM="Alexandrium minutum" /LENGTH=126 /DNA_ID=CAMNT_0000793117 /DNA_START=91 /DNA_END=471 /DNA_ORIENTATION=+ /assembly_acc=CAM_ASM_000350
MARAMRSSKLAVVLVAVVSALALQWLVAPALFIQPRQSGPSPQELTAIGTAVTLTASLPAEAFKGPLSGSEACSSKPLVWFIYPLCDPVFLAAPTYFFPLLVIFYAVIVTTIQLLIPATQPDEDLR